MPTPSGSPTDAPPGLLRDPHAEAVVALHLVALRRQFGVIKNFFGDEPPHRAREALWVALEVVRAHQQGCPIALRDLVTQAEGLLSGPTLSRVVRELERDGVLACKPSPEDSRVKLLRPTPLALEVLVSRADAAFTEFAAVVNDTKKRLAAAEPT